MNTPRYAKLHLITTACMTLSLIAVNAVPSTSVAAPTAGTSPAQLGDSDQRNRKFQQAEALYLSGRLKDAAAAFEELTKGYPRDARVWLKYGNTLTKLGTYDGAAAAFQSAAELDPTQGAADLNLALVRLAQAQVALDSALSALGTTSPEHAQAEALQREIKILLGAPDANASPH